MILLILRILYDEKKRELSVSDEVIINLGDIQDKYLSLQIREKMIDKTTMRNALSMLRRFQIIETLDRDLGNEESRILIYDSILMAVRIDDIRKAYENWKSTERESRQMKKLTRMKLINWHRFENCIIDFGDSTLLSGENGAGKSTLLDAIQFVVTCSASSFNKAAHENGKRKLTGYIRCKTGRENRPMKRTGEVTAHVALEFYEERQTEIFHCGRGSGFGFGRTGNRRPLPDR